MLFSVSEVWNIVKTVRVRFTLPRVFVQRDIRNAVQNSKATFTKFSVSYLSRNKSFIELKKTCTRELFDCYIR